MNLSDAMFRRPVKKEAVYLFLVALLYGTGIGYVYFHDLSFGAILKYGLLQPKGITGESARLFEIDTPLSWNIPQVLWFIYIKASAVLVELFQYWVAGMMIAAALVAFVPWEGIKKKMGHGGARANFLAASAGAVIPICSCGIVPVLAGMVDAGIPLGPTFAFLIAAPMLNVPAVFMTAGVLGWKLAAGRIAGTFAIALLVGGVLSAWQKKERLLRRFIKLAITPTISTGLQQFAYQVAIKLSQVPGGLSTDEIAPNDEEKLYMLGEAGILDRNREGMWHLPDLKDSGADVTGACFVLPEENPGMTKREKGKKLITVAWDFFLQLNYYLVLAVIIAGAIKVVLPTKVVVTLVGGGNLNSVLVSSLVAVFAYVCTYVEIPTALALIQKGMGGGATLAYLLGGPGLSLPSIAMLSGVFKPRVLALYVGVSFVGCVLMGCLFNLLV